MSEQSRLLRIAAPIGMLVTMIMLVSPLWSWQDETPIVTKLDPEVYQVPETEDVVELERFVDSLLRLRPTNGREYLQHIDLMPPALDQAARKIMSLAGDAKSISYQKAAYITVVARIFSLDKLPDDEIVVLLNEIAGRLDAAKNMEESAGLAAQVAERLESLKKFELARQSYERFGNLLTNRTEPVLAIRGQRMLGSARRLGLIGSEIELSGNLTNQQPLDWAQLAGKVVLVDYWASWCGPCLADFPRLVKARQKYREQGFEIVGVCLDKDLDRVIDTMAEEGVTWPCLFEEGLAWDHPMVLKFGIGQIPATILVGRDGRVIAMGLHGAALDAKLAELLDEPQTP